MSTWIDTIPADRLADLLNKHGEALMKRHHTTDPHFAVWLEAVDRAVRRRVMVSYDDLEDWDYWSYYESGMSPVDAAVTMIEDTGFFGGDFE